MSTAQCADTPNMQMQLRVHMHASTHRLPHMPHAHTRTHTHVHPHTRTHTVHAQQVYTQRDTQQARTVIHTIIDDILCNIIIYDTIDKGMLYEIPSCV